MGHLEAKFSLHRFSAIIMNKIDKFTYGLVQDYNNSPFMPLLTHLPLVPHMCVSAAVSIGSDNGLSPMRRQAII